MPEVEVKIEGLAQLQKRLKKFPDVAKPIFAKAINLSLAEIVFNARDPQFLFKTPRMWRTGYLELSFSEAAAMVRATPDDLKGTIGPTAQYAIIVHEGLGKMKSPNRFMLRIKQKSIEKINAIFKEALKQVTEKTAND